MAEKYYSLTELVKLTDNLIAAMPTSFYNGIMAVRGKLATAPAADVVPVRRGRWIWNPNGMDWGLGAWVCSECHAKPETWWEADKKYNPYRCSGGHFCGNCGARMDGDGE